MLTRSMTFTGTDAHGDDTAGATGIPVGGGVPRLDVERVQDGSSHRVLAIDPAPTQARDLM
jgi:hypothetical protein